jgi:CheY-like chemotaxis protein
MTTRFAVQNKRSPIFAPYPPPVHRSLWYAESVSAIHLYSHRCAGGYRRTNLPLQISTSTASGSARIADASSWPRNHSRPAAFPVVRMVCHPRGRVMYRKIGPLEEPERTPTLLLVEDEVLVRAATAKYLRECGFAVIEAVDADQALEIIRANGAVEAVFADVKLPGRLSGADLAVTVREDHPTVKVLLTSGVAPFPEVDGVFLLKKPYFLFEVERRLKSMLGLIPTGDAPTAR